MIRCPKCGAPTEPNTETRNLCQKCFISTVAVREEKRKIVYCGSCGKIRVRDKWLSNSSISNILDEILAQKNVVSKTKDKIVYESLEGNRKTLTQLYLKRTLCTNCLTQKTDSYLFEVKLRVEGRSMSARETMYFMELIRKTCLEASDQDFVYRFSENKDGVDLLVSSKKVAEQIVAAIRKRFDGKLTQSYKLVGEKHDRRRVFKTTYSYRMLSPSVGSIYRIGNKLYQVTRVGVDDVTLSAIKSDEKMTLKRQELISMYVADRIKVLSQSGSII